jgi:hypothetical protein
MDFYHDPQLGVAVCIRCGTGMVPDGKAPFKNHLRDHPHRLKGGAFKLTSQYLLSLRLTAASQVKHPPADKQPISAIPHLKVCRGYRCLRCDSWLSVNEESTRRHVTSQHRVFTGRQRQGYESCLLQTIFSQSRLIRYFRVVVPEEDPRAAQLSQVDVSQDPFLTRQREIQQKIAEEECRQADLVVGSKGHPADVPVGPVLWLRQISQGLQQN